MPVHLSVDNKMSVIRLGGFLMVGLVRLCASEVMVTCLFVLPGCYSIGRVVPSELARSRAMLQMPWSLMVGSAG